MSRNIIIDPILSCQKGFFFSFGGIPIKAIKYCMEKSSLIMPNDTFEKSLSK